jgi:methylenetetrahydrofolate reductase (NADPH)
MPIQSAYTSSKPAFSFELFPPKTDAGVETLFRHVAELCQFSPAYITCTYGAGGSTRERTLEIVDRVRQQFQIPVASHLTCVGATVDELRAYLAEAKSREIDAIVALRGDPPEGEKVFQAVEGGLRYANQLVELIRAEFGCFEIAVAGYPETHQEAASPEADLDNLKRKVDCGVEAVITQLFYSNDDYFRFCDRCTAAGIDKPIVPGILPVISLAQIQRITTMCAAKLPQAFVDRLGENDDPDWQFQVGVEHAAAQVKNLLEQGAPGIHFYVLNKSQSTAAVLKGI